MNGSSLLWRLHAVVRRYVVLPSDHALVAVVLWIVATHMQSAWNNATRLAIISPEKRCGKSRLMEVVAALSYEPLMTSNISTAALFRVIGMKEVPPTILLDEADTIFGTKIKAEQNEDLRGLFNSGYARDLPSIRCVGPNQVPTEFKNFAMAALAGIGKLPETVMDRAVVVHMGRKAKDEHVDPFRQRRDGPALYALRDEITDWLSGRQDELQAADPELPLEDRAADNWVSLVAIADLAGGEWPDLARQAARYLTAQAEADDSKESLNITLLRDIREWWQDSLPEFVSSKDLASALRTDENAPWSELELTPRRLAMRLAEFGIRPKPAAGGSVRGYRRSAFQDAFSRYLEPSHPVEAATPALHPSQTVTTVTNGSDLQEQCDTSNGCDTSKRHTVSNRHNVSADQDRFVTDVTVRDTSPAENASCPICGEETSVGLVPTKQGPGCRKCLAGINSGGVCKTCSRARYVFNDGRCKGCRDASKAGAA